MKNIKSLVFIGLAIVFLSSCGTQSSNGELIGVPGRPDWYEPDPYGMAFIPQGSYNMGPNDQDVPFSLTSQSKTVSVDPFWMDVTEITNNEYRQFVFWVRDSIAMRKCVMNSIDDFKAEIDVENVDPEEYDHDNPKTCYLNWENTENLWNGKSEEVRDAIRDMYLEKQERFWGIKEIDSRKLIYEYYWVDLKQAALKQNRYNFETESYEGTVIDAEGNVVDIVDRSSFIMTGSIYVYPDTLVWMADYTYSYNEPIAKKYFWHPAFDDYPVVGVTWKQATAFSIWRTQIMNNYLHSIEEVPYEDYRLPSESEWEYAARGGLALSMYPWGGPYTRNNTGCFIANFKPLRGNYGDDGANRTISVGTYAPNEFGLYDMAGNVAEWTSNAFDESAYSFTHDLNPDYTYNALAEDPAVLKRKVIRGGSWKDIAYYLQVGVRSYEYQDTAKSYVGFRCVRSYLGRDAQGWDMTSWD
jgi:formylglycine-generating enzyme required for sulfatase activity